MQSALLKQIRPQIRWESTARVPAEPDKVAVIAHWSTNSQVTRSFEALVSAITKLGYFALVVSACTDKRALRFSRELPETVAILRKPNIGYDFGSWAVGMLKQPQIFRASRVLQVNDSLLGPFAPLDEIIADFEEDRGDYWGLVRNNQMGSHLQSYFVGYTPEVLQSPTFHDFWMSVRVQKTKSEIIRKYEHGLSRRLYNEGFVGDAFIEPQLVGDGGLNPMISAWDEVLRAGVPFLKRELITSPEIVAEGERIPERLQREFGINIQEWF